MSGSEELNQCIIENSNELIEILNDKFEIEYLNESPHLSVLGYSKKDLLGEIFISLNNPIDYKKIRRYLRYAIKTGEIKYEATLKHKNGCWIWFENKVKSFKDEEGNQKCILFLRDIHSQKSTERKLNETERRLKSIFKGDPNPVYAWQKLETDFVLVDYNAAAETITRGEIIKHVGKTATQLYLNERNQPELIENLNLCFNEKKNFSKEIKMLIDFIERERLLFINYTYVPPDLVLSHFEDITEQKRAEQKLIESEEKFRTIAEQGLMGIAIIQHNVVKYINKQHADLLGYTIEEILNWQPDEWWKTIYLEDKQLILNQIKRKDDESVVGIRSYIARGIQKNGNILWFEVWLKSIKYHNKNAFLITLVDITKKRIAENNLRKSEEDFRKAYERENFYKDLFMHDMNNILQGMLTSLDLCDLSIGKSNRLEDIKDNMSILRDQIDRGKNLVGNVRKFSELEESNLSLKEIVIREVLKKAIEFVKKSSRDKEIHFQIENFTKNYMIKSDDFLIDVFENILFNAVKHNNKNNIEILIKASELEKDRRQFLKMEFMDNGPGIDDAKKFTIFSRKYKGDKSVSGIGLGLSLVSKILERYGAQIWIENRIAEDPKQGSNFVILIPLFN